MKYRLLMLAAVFLLIAFVGGRDATGEPTLDEFRTAGRLVCTWDEGKMDDAKAAIAAADLKLVRVSPFKPVGACTWDAALTQAQLDKLVGSDAILDCYPDTRVFIVDDSPRDMIDARNEELTTAAALVCVWKEGTKESSIKYIEEEVKSLKIRRVSTDVPKMHCVWASEENRAEAIEKLIAHPDIDHCYADTETLTNPLPGRPPLTPPVTKGKSACYPIDPKFDELWGMRNIRATQAWCCTQTSDIVVAVIDTGVDYRHPDLRDNCWRNPKEIPGNNKDDDGNKIVDDVFGADFVDTDPTTYIATGDPADEHYHGTHVAGTIGAVGNNNEGVSGVCWRVQMISIRVLDENGSGYGFDTADGIRYAVKMGAKVVNLSLGQKPGTNPSKDVQEAVEEAEKAGVLCVFSAGNNSNDNDAKPTPHSSYDNANIVAVASITEQEKLSSFSNFGKTSVDLAAPGSDILSTFPTTETAAMRSNGYPTNYHRISGTSMAAPHVTGAIALAWAKPTYAHYTAAEIKKLILDKARRIDTLNGKVLTGATLDIGFLCKVETPPPPNKPCPPILIWKPPCWNYCPQHPRRVYPRCGRRY